MRRSRSATSWRLLVGALLRLGELLLLLALALLAAPLLAQAGVVGQVAGGLLAAAHDLVEDAHCGPPLLSRSRAVGTRRARAGNAPPGRVGCARDDRRGQPPRAREGGLAAALRDRPRAGRALHARSTSACTSPAPSTSPATARRSSRPTTRASTTRSSSRPARAGHVRFMAKSELIEARYGRLLVRLGAFPVRRGQSDADALETARTILRQGGLLALFPEGTRVRDPEELGHPAARRRPHRARHRARRSCRARSPAPRRSSSGPFPKPRRVQVAFAEPIPVAQLAPTPGGRRRADRGHALAGGGGRVPAAAGTPDADRGGARRARHRRGRAAPQAPQALGRRAARPTLLGRSLCPDYRGAMELPVSGLPRERSDAARNRELILAAARRLFDAGGAGRGLDGPGRGGGRRRQGHAVPALRRPRRPCARAARRARARVPGRR